MTLPGCCVKNPSSHTYAKSRPEPLVTGALSSLALTPAAFTLLNLRAGVSLGLKGRGTRCRRLEASGALVVCYLISLLEDGVRRRSVGVTWSPISHISEMQSPRRYGCRRPFPSPFIKIAGNHRFAPLSGLDLAQKLVEHDLRTKMKVCYRIRTCNLW